MDRHRILILGGTTEARQLAEALAGDVRYAVTISLAGRTVEPRPLPVPTRSGGFGGAEGLAHYITEHAVDLVIDATHPFAARMSVNAAAASAMAACPLLALRRPHWQKQPGDTWISVNSVEQAVSTIGEAPRHVFLAIGRQEAHHFEAAPQHVYLVRSIDPVTPPLTLPHVTAILDGGPFTIDSEIALMKNHAIECVVSKNSGGDATYAKIAAARQLGLPVIMVERVKPPGVETVDSVEEAVRRLHQIVSGDRKRGV